MLRIEHLTKTYGEKKAVDDLSLHIEPGQIYGFIGHNGAGKTTTIKACCGILKFDAGEIYVCGKSIKTQALECKRDIAYIPDNPDLYDFMTGIQFLNFIADIFAVPADLRPHGVHFIAQLAPGEDQVQVDQGVVVPLDVLPVGGSLGGELRQDAVDLLLLLGLQLNILVVGLDHPHRLHEQRRSGGGDVVDQSRQVALVLRLHRHHEAAVPLGDDGLLQNFPIAGGGDDLLKDLAALGLGRPHVAADVRQLRAGGVGDGVLVWDGPLDLLLQKAVRVQGEEELVDGRAFLVLSVIVLHTPHIGEQPRDVQKFPRVEHAAAFRTRERLAHIAHAAESGTAAQQDHLARRVRLVEQAVDLAEIIRWRQPSRPRLGLRAQSNRAVWSMGRDTTMA